MGLRGAKAHIARLKRLQGPEMTQAVRQVLFVAGQKVQIAAQVSITRGAVSGAQHVPSAPGQPPNNDTGVLANNIETAFIGPFTVQVSSNAPYSTPLEFGTSRMAARPFMRPARDKVRPEAEALMVKAVRKLAGNR